MESESKQRSEEKIEAAENFGNRIIFHYEIEGLTLFFVTCQSDGQAADENGPTLGKRERPRQIRHLGQRWALQPMEPSKELMGLRQQVIFKILCHLN